MSTAEKKMITVETTVKAPITEVWKSFTSPEDITGWNFAIDEWHAPSASNDLREGGRFVYRMEAKDGSFGFDYSGVYDEIKPKELIRYTLDDDRKVEVLFKVNGEETTVIETFEAEETNSIELQQGGWQAILNNFKKYTEAKYQGIS